MIHHDEANGLFILSIQGAIVTFPTLGGMITFAEKKYGICLLTQLN